MTGQELKSSRTALGIKTIADLARVLNKPYRTVQDWESGRRRVDPMVEAVLFLLTKYNGAIAALRARAQFIRK